MSETPCMDIPIADFDVNEECLNGLRRVGITKVGEVVEMLEMQEGLIVFRSGPPRGLGKYIDEMITQLKAMDCWPESLN